MQESKSLWDIDGQGEGIVWQRMKKGLGLPIFIQSSQI